MKSLQLSRAFRSGIRARWAYGWCFSGWWAKNSYEHAHMHPNTRDTWEYHTNHLQLGQPQLQLGKPQEPWQSYQRPKQQTPKQTINKNNRPQSKPKTATSQSNTQTPKQSPKAKDRGLDSDGYQAPEDAMLRSFLLCRFAKETLVWSLRKGGLREVIYILNILVTHTHTNTQSM